MSAIVLTLRSQPDLRVDAAPLLPERLAGLAADDIRRIELACGNRAIAVGELFDVVAGDANELRLVGACDKFDFVGKGLAAGRIAIEGPVGAYAGLAMTGGELCIGGDAGPWAAAELAGGRLEIGGHAGERLAAPLPGGMRGMSGGTVVVRGNAGDRAGDRLRRGILIVEGGAGAYLGSRMIAGTIVVFGAVGAYPGFAMKRGTLFLAAAPTRLLPTFGDCGVHDLGFLYLLRRAYGSQSPPLAASSGRVRRLAGDAAVAGKGEILLPAG